MQTRAMASGRLALVVAVLSCASCAARANSVCGGAPQTMVPFDLEAHASGPPRPTWKQAERRALQELASWNATDTEDEGEDEGDGEDEGWWEWEDRGRHDLVMEPGYLGNGSEVAGTGRALLRMPYEKKREGCARKRLARVYYENDSGDPAVKKNVLDGEAKLAACLEDLQKCDQEAYGQASSLGVRKKVRELFIPGSVSGRHYKTCAIVGNAGHMTKQKFGKYIDSHDLVLRFNTQALGKYKANVGSKVTMRILNNFNTIMACCRGRLPEGKRRKIDMVLWFPAARREMRRACEKKFPNHKVHFLSRRFIGKEVAVMKELRKEGLRFGFGPFGGWKQLTSGALGLMMLLTICDQVSVYGITTYRQSKNDQYGGRNKKTLNGNRWHDWKGESVVWRLLHAMKEINICSV